MTQEEKQLLLVDLCARLPYGVKVKFGSNLIEVLTDVNLKTFIFNGFGAAPLPYLRPMSSMTEEEKKECNKLRLSGGMAVNVADYTDWLNAHHFDYRGLIEKGLALEAPEGMYC